MPTIDDVFAQAMQLDERERELLVNKIAGTLELAAVDLDDEALEEIAQRVERLDRGETQVRDAFEAIEDARRKLRESRAP